jgi:hypothetical protein
VSYKNLFGDMGFSRCSICLNDFLVNEKLKQFPGCEHLYHIKCLDLWMSIEPNCPNCLKTYLQTSAFISPSETGISEGALPQHRVAPSNATNNLLAVPRVEMGPNGGLNSPRPRPNN